MSIFAMFADRAEQVSVAGKGEEKAVITRRGKTISPQVIQNERMCTLQDDTVYESGDLMVAADSRYYIVAKQVSLTGAVQAHLRKINVEVGIIRLEPIYNDRMNKVGEKEVVVESGVSAVQYTVSARMKMYDAGLLPSTVKKYILPTLDIRFQDRIKVDGNIYQVDGIDNDKYESILEVQCSYDTRKTVKED